MSISIISFLIAFIHYVTYVASSRVSDNKVYDFVGIKHIQHNNIQKKLNKNTRTKKKINDEGQADLFAKIMRTYVHGERKTT